MKDKYEIKKKIAKRKYEIELLVIEIEKIDKEEINENTAKASAVWFHVESSEWEE